MTSGAAPDRGRLAVALVLLAAFVTAACSLGIGVRSTYGGRAAVDEPQYLLTALSLAEDGDLDISDELRERRWREFFDRDLPVQTSVLDDGRQVSPHDPLLPALLAVPVALGGDRAAKATLAVLAGLLAALTCWVAVRRLGVRARVAVPVVGLLSTSVPLGAYATQVYPELPAAVLVTTAFATLTGRLTRRGVAVVGACATALPWLSVKYAPVAAALTCVALARLARRRDRPAAAALAGGLAVMGAAYLVAHRVLYGGWTSYATGDHFERTGEFAVVGTSPDMAGRAVRLVGLLVDRGFGIGAWQPAWLLCVPAVATVLAARGRFRAELVLPLAAGWLTATFVALTAHGYWVPGRQVVVVLPLAALALCVWADGARWRIVTTAVLGAAGLASFVAVLLDGRRLELTWVTHLERVGSPLYQGLRPLLPDYREPGRATWLLHALWMAAIAVVAVSAWRRTRPAGAPPLGARARLGLAAGAVALVACGGAADDGSDVRHDDGYQDPPSPAAAAGY